MTPISMSKLLTLHAQVERHGVTYGLGAKAHSLHDEPGDFSAIDCSGYTRWLLFKASGGNLTIPDGSQNQRAWAEQGGLKKVAYKDAAAYIGEKGQRLFICFIKPFTNGCGNVGHVWLLTNTDGDAMAETIESHGGHGPNSRPWNTGVLIREGYSCYELEVA